MRKSYMIYRTVPFSMTLKEPYPRFQGHAILWRWISQSTDIISMEWNTNRDLHTPYSTVSFRMTLSDLAKYSMTRSVARSLCDSWASCIWITTYTCIFRTFQAKRNIQKTRSVARSLCDSWASCFSILKIMAIFRREPPNGDVECKGHETRSSAVAKRPRDISCHWIFC